MGVIVNRRRMMGGGNVPDYILFEDQNIWNICCQNWGDYNEIVITDNGDDTVDIVTTFKSMLNGTVVDSKLISSQTNVDNTGGTYTAGTTKESVGITEEQCNAAKVNITSVFAGSFTDFKEFRFFTSATNSTVFGSVSATFSGTLVFPYNISADSYAYQKLITEYIIVPEGCTKNWGWQFFFYADFYGIIFPSTIPIIPNVCKIGLSHRRDVIIRGSNVVPITGQSYYSGNNADRVYFYVPDTLLASYKEASSWVSNGILQDHILPISQYQGDIINIWESIYGIF